MGLALPRLGLLLTLTSSFLVSDPASLAQLVEVRPVVGPVVRLGRRRVLLPGPRRGGPMLGQMLLLIPLGVGQLLLPMSGVVRLRSRDQLLPVLGVILLPPLAELVRMSQPPRPVVLRRLARFSHRLPPPGPAVDDIRELTQGKLRHLARRDARRGRRPGDPGRG